MTTYILLRKNKESVPLTIDDLKALDLVPEDRIWVEGQSVYWLSPADIIELKPLLAGKDRPDIGNTKSFTGDDENGEEKYEPLAAEVIVQPGFSNKINQTEINSEKNNSTASVNEYWKKYQPGEKAVQPIIESVYVQEQIPEKYSSPLPERNYNRKKNSIDPGLKRIAWYAGILVLGLGAGLLIKNSGSPKKNFTNQSIPVTITNESKQPDSSVLKTEPVGSNADSLINNEPLPTNTTVKKEEPIAERTQSITPSQKIRTNNPDSATAVLIPEKKEEEKETVENDKKASTRPSEDISSFVRVKTNDYIVAAFGGIRNLELTLTNDSKYMLDKVTVDLQYLKPRDEFLRSEHIIFSGIPPGGSQIKAVEKSNRGVKVVCKVIKIVTKESGF